MAKKFAVFDIDGTLIRWQMFHAVVDELVRQGSIDKKKGDAIREARMAWKRRVHIDSFKHYEETLVATYLGVLKDINIQTFGETIETSFETYKDQVYTYTRRLVKSLKQEGYVLIAISGSHQEMVEKIANHYGFDIVVGSQYSIKNGAYTGEERTPVIIGKGKLLKNIVEEHGLDWKDSVAVGDTASDISMLELVERPIAFNPNQVLLKAARTHGWKIVVERKNVVYELTSGEDGLYRLAQ